MSKDNLTNLKLPATQQWRFHQVDTSCMLFSAARISNSTYHLAVTNNLEFPKNWHDEEQAGKFWLMGFMKRHKTQLSLRTPEGCSLSRATSFNYNNVEIFFTNLKDILERYPVLADGSRIFNLDETGTTTVPDCPKVVAEKGTRKVSSMTSGERGTLVTTCCTIAANGIFLPPVMVFPRTHFENYMLNDCFPGTLGLATQSGWMNQDLFVRVIDHVIRYSHCSMSHPILLIFDNHESHLSLEAINKGKENGIVILTIPPHTSNKMQPLDVGVYSSFQASYKHAVKTHLMQNPGKSISIYNVAACVNKAFTKAMTPMNIQKAFRQCGIFPYNPDQFQEEDFMCSEVTNRPNPEESIIQSSMENVTVSQIPSSSIQTNMEIVDVSTIPSSSFQETSSTQSNMEIVDFSNISSSSKQTSPIQSNMEIVDVSNIPSSSKHTSPKVLFGFPKAAPRKTKITRERGRSFIPTDTPEKEKIEEKQKIKEKKKMDIEKNIMNKWRKKLQFEEDRLHLDCESDGSDSGLDIPCPVEIRNCLPNEGDYVLVKFVGDDKKVIHYLGKVTQKASQGQYEIIFYRKSNNMNGQFSLPQIPDIDQVPQKNIISVLTPPKLYGSTKRQQGYISFDLDFSKYNLH